MRIDTTILISAFTLLFSATLGLYNLVRSGKKDIQADVTQLATVMVKLETISSGISEIKSEIWQIKDEVQENRERIIKVEQSTKQAHKRITELQEEKL